MRWIAILLLVAAPLAAQEPPAQLVLRATGEGRAPEGAAGGQATLLARRAATVVALRNLAAAVTAMAPGNADDWASGVVLKGHKVVETTDGGDGSCRVTVELPIAELAIHLRDEVARRGALEAELREKTEKIAALEAEKLALTNERSALQAELAALRQKLDALVASLRHQIDALRALVDDAK